MHNEFAAIIERDGEWFVAYSPEIPGANGQGHSVEEATAVKPHRYCCTIEQLALPVLAAGFLSVARSSISLLSASKRRI